MRFSVAPLLLHSEHIPVTARHALRAAYEGPFEERKRHLESVARILHRELQLDCDDARELVGLTAGGDCVQGSRDAPQMAGGGVTNTCA